jgi:hypothetical protein
MFLLLVRAGVFLVTGQMALLFKALATVFTWDGEVLGDVIARTRKKILAELVGVSAVGPFASRINDRTLDVLVGGRRFLRNLLTYEQLPRWQTVSRMTLVASGNVL